MLRGSHQRGIALISVLFIAVVLMILMFIFSSVLTSESQSVKAADVVNSSVQIADAVTERARLKIVSAYYASTLSGEEFVEKVRAGQIADLNGIATEDVAGFQGSWEIRELSAQNKNNQWIDIAATAATAQGAQTVIRRISLSTNSIFELAMLSETTDCLYCHVRVNGDVGQFNAFRPGFGEEGGRGTGSGRGSNVNGTAFLAGGASGDDNDPDGIRERVNGALFNDVQENYTGNKLPRREDDIARFPPLDRGRMQRNAYGSITGPPTTLIFGIPEGSGPIAAIPTASNNPLVNGKYEGNLILKGGTLTDPLVLDGDIYVSGDVIIEGYVTGRGAIYSGRNTYIAGELINANPADKPNTGACSGITDPDACAVANIRAGKDEVRIGARGNIIMGDYTEEKLDGSKNLWRDTQGSEYFRQEFGLTPGTEICYRTDNGDELIEKGDSGIYEDVDGNIVAASSMTCTSGTSDPYDYSLRPGQIRADGSFETWISDGLYKEILGTEDRGYDMWRHNVDDFPTREDLKNELVKQLDGDTYDISDTSIEDIATALIDGGDPAIDLKDDAGNILGMVKVNGKTIRVLIEPKETYTKQTTRVDAFLYANQRIANKTFLSPLVVNGGLVAKNIGILAPGASKEWWMDSRYNFLDNLDCKGVDATRTAEVEDTLGQVAIDFDSDDCKFTINYDHRLKNGGYGFNFVAAEVGQTLSWRLADKLSDRVTP